MPKSSERAAVDLLLGRETRVASRDEAGWSAVFPSRRLAGRELDRLAIGWREQGPDGRTRASRGTARAWRGSPTRDLELRDGDSRREVHVTAGSFFEDATLVSFPVPAAATTELKPIGDAWRIEPARLPLRRAARMSFTAPPGTAMRGVGLYRRSDDGWQWLAAAADSVTRSIAGSSRQLGAFALLRDERAPRVPRWAVAPDKSGLPYSRWAIEANVEEDGSGLDARASWLEVDGRRVPTEWDPEAGRLRWRPVAPPTPGQHRVRIVAADKAGNTSSLEATFDVSR